MCDILIFMKRYCLILICIVIFASCKTTPDQIDENLTPPEFFQYAQEAVVERNDYKTALMYYQTFIERFPEDMANVVAAEYEIAFIHYKKNDYETAKQLFTSLLARYDDEESSRLPRWPAVLAEKLLNVIGEE